MYIYFLKLQVVNLMKNKLVENFIFFEGLRNLRDLSLVDGYTCDQVTSIKNSCERVIF